MLISLLKTNTKITSKVLSVRIKNASYLLLSSNQTEFVKNRFIKESWRLILDILEIANTPSLESIIVIVDIEKAFDSDNQGFLLHIVPKYEFAIDFVSWIKTILKNQGSCIINGEKTIKYFKLVSDFWQEDPISAYLIILVLKISFISVKNNPKDTVSNIFTYEFLYTVYDDDTTFFSKVEYLS